MVTYSVSHQTPSGSFVLQRGDQTDPDREQEARHLEHPAQEPCALRVRTGLTSAWTSQSTEQHPWTMGEYALSDSWSGRQMSALSTWDNGPSRGSGAGRQSECHLGSIHVASLPEELSPESLSDLLTWRTLSQVWGRCFRMNSTSLPSHGSFLYKCFLAETTNANQRLTDEHNNKEAMWVKGASWDKWKIHQLCSQCNHWTRLHGPEYMHYRISERTDSKNKWILSEEPACQPFPEQNSQGRKPLYIWLSPFSKLGPDHDSQSSC